jgi:hypothetical protein
MSVQLGYAQALANQVSERSVPGSLSVDLARVAREMVVELRKVREDLDRHHAYIAGRDGEPDCIVCKWKAAS